MDIQGKICVVTGAASGIGRALAIGFQEAGAKHVICSDINLDGAKATADQIGGTAIQTNVGKESDIKTLIETTESTVGPIDLFVSNAGIGGASGGAEVPNDDWQAIWDINLMSHVWAARYLVPLMTERGGGYLINTASAAGLLTQVGAAPYSVTKHAAVSLAEWLAITHGDAGIKVSVLCPQYVRTEMTKGMDEVVSAVGDLIEPEDVAKATLKTIADGGFLILPHPQVGEYLQAKTQDYDRWIGGMRKLNRHIGTLK